MVENTLEAIAGRTSVRKYDMSREVPDEMIERLLKAAMSAPSARNLQPWDFIVVKDRDTLKALAEANPHGGMAAEAAFAIVVCGTPGQSVQGYGHEYWVQDCSAAAENILLAAHAMGLGAVWTASHPVAERVAGVKRILGIPEDTIPLCVIPAGWPADGQGRPKDKWKPERIHFDRW